MINTLHLSKVAVVWMSIVYAVCFLAVALFPGISTGFMRWGLHSAADMGEQVLTIGTFFSGLVIWNVIAMLAVGLFAWLYNSFNRN